MYLMYAKPAFVGLGLFSLCRINNLSIFNASWPFYSVGPAAPLAPESLGEWSIEYRTERG